MQSSLINPIENQHKVNIAGVVLSFLQILTVDAAYVVGITYQTIDVKLVSELLGGLSGMYMCQLNADCFSFFLN